MGRVSRTPAPVSAEGPQPHVPEDVKLQPNGVGSKKPHKLVPRGSRTATRAPPATPTPCQKTPSSISERFSRCFSLPLCSRAVCGAAFQQLSALRSPTLPSVPGVNRPSRRLGRSHGQWRTIHNPPGVSLHKLARLCAVPSPAAPAHQWQHL